MAEALGRAHAGGGHDDVPAALHAGHLRRVRRSRARGSCSIRSARRRSHAWAVAQGAVFEDVGLWKRACYFPRDGEDMHAAVARECSAVRDAAGIFDASTLGKIEVVGPDAAEFMNRMYTQLLDQARAGPLPLRPDAAARTATSSTTASSRASPPTAST